MSVMHLADITLGIWGAGKVLGFENESDKVSAQQAYHRIRRIRRTDTGITIQGEKCHAESYKWEHRAQRRV